MWRSLQGFPRAFRLHWTQPAVRPVPPQVVTQDDEGKPHGPEVQASPLTVRTPRAVVRYRLNNGNSHEEKHKKSDRHNGWHGCSQHLFTGSPLEAVGWGTVILVGLQVSQYWHLGIRRACRDRELLEQNCPLFATLYKLMHPLSWFENGLGQVQQNIADTAKKKKSKKKNENKVLGDGAEDQVLFEELEETEELSYTEPLVAHSHFTYRTFAAIQLPLDTAPISQYSLSTPSHQSSHIANALTESEQLADGVEHFLQHFNHFDSSLRCHYSNHDETSDVEQLDSRLSHCRNCDSAHQDGDGVQLNDSSSNSDSDSSLWAYSASGASEESIPSIDTQTSSPTSVVGSSYLSVNSTESSQVNAAGDGTSSGNQSLIGASSDCITRSQLPPETVDEALSNLKQIRDKYVALLKTEQGCRFAERGCMSDAIFLWIQASRCPTAAAHFNLGVVYETGNGLKQDLSKAVDHYQSAAALGHAEAAYNLAVLYMTQEEKFAAVSPDVPWDLLKLAADKGLAKAQTELGVLYTDEEHCDMDRAAHLFKKAAQKKDVNAQYYLGVCHENGWGVARNECRAAKLYSMAAKAGHPDAQYNLAVFFEHGLGGLPPSRSSALDLYQRAGAGDDVLRLEKNIQDEHAEKKKSVEEWLSSSTLSKRSQSNPVLHKQVQVAAFHSVPSLQWFLQHHLEQLHLWDVDVPSSLSHRMGSAGDTSISFGIGSVTFTVGDDIEEEKEAEHHSHLQQSLMGLVEHGQFGAVPKRSSEMGRGMSDASQHSYSFSELQNGLSEQISCISCS